MPTKYEVEYWYRQIGFLKDQYRTIAFDTMDEAFEFAGMVEDLSRQCASLTDDTQIKDIYTKEELDFVDHYVFRGCFTRVGSIYRVERIKIGGPSELSRPTML